jgi:hypothetical protein
MHGVHAAAVRFCLARQTYSAHSRLHARGGYMHSGTAVRFCLARLKGVDRVSAQ